MSKYCKFCMDNKDDMEPEVRLDYSEEKLFLKTLTNRYNMELAVAVDVKAPYLNLYFGNNQHGLIWNFPIVSKKINYCPICGRKL